MVWGDVNRFLPNASREVWWRRKDLTTEGLADDGSATLSGCFSKVAKKDEGGTERVMRLAAAVEALSSHPIAAAFTSSSMKGTYWAKLSANICTSFAACAS